MPRAPRHGDRPVRARSHDYAPRSHWKARAVRPAPSAAAALIVASLLGQHQGELAMAPRIGGVDLQELPDRRLGCGGAAVAQPFDPDLVQGIVVREPLACSGQMFERRDLAFGLGQQLRGGPIAVPRPGLGHQHL